MRRFSSSRGKGSETIPFSEAFGARGASSVQFSQWLRFFVCFVKGERESSSAVPHSTTSVKRSSCSPEIRFARIVCNFKSLWDKSEFVFLLLIKMEKSGHFRKKKKLSRQMSPVKLWVRFCKAKRFHSSFGRLMPVAYENVIVTQSQQPSLSHTHNLVRVLLMVEE